MKIQFFLDRLLSTHVLRFGLLFYFIYAFGAVADMRWHTVNVLRDHYFILPHILMYLGVIGIMSSFLLLYLKKEKISLWVFLVFPFMSFFDEFWHNFYGVELATSPMMFWSPAHWGFGIAMICVLMQFLKSNIEDNIQIKTFLQAALLGWIFGFARFLLVPLFPFSFYENLHTNFNILSVIFLYLFLISLLKILGNKAVILPMLFALTIVQAPGFNFLIGEEYVYGSSSAFMLSYLGVFLITVFDKYNLKHYLLNSFFVVSLIFILVFLSKNSFSFSYYFFSLTISASFTIIYFYFEQWIYEKIQNKKWFKDFKVLLG